MLAEVLEDALKIGFTRDTRLIERVLGQICARVVALPFGQWYKVFDDATARAGTLGIRLQRAGHILGSAYVECDATTAAGQKRIVFSGDIGAPDSPLLPAPRPPERADRLVLEATYGDRDHEDRATRRHRLKADYLARTGRPCVVIAGSGMCAGGRVVNYHQVGGYSAHAGQSDLLRFVAGITSHKRYSKSDRPAARHAALNRCRRGPKHRR